jgi:EamA domain-containing membrane protein RarD
MRTVKQLTIEKEILRQYSELIHQTVTSVTRSLCIAVSFKLYFFYRNHRNYLYITALTLAITWSLPMYILAALYALALSLVEHNQLEPRNIIM